MDPREDDLSRPAPSPEGDDHLHDHDTDRLRQEIEARRADMDQTLDELVTQLSPQHLVRGAVNELMRTREGKLVRNIAVGAAAATAGALIKNIGASSARKVSDTVKAHPIPTLLIGAGVAWLVGEAIMERRRNRGGAPEMYEEAGLAESASPGRLSRAAHAASEGMHATAEAAGRAASSAAAAARAAASKTARGAAAAAGAVKHGVDTGREKFGQAVEANPLAVGLGLLAAGVLVGMAIPATQRENKVLGSASSQLKKRAREGVSDAIERGKQVAAATRDAAMEEAKRQGLTLDDVKAHAAQVAKTAADTAKKEAARHASEATGRHA